MACGRQSLHDRGGQLHSNAGKLSQKTGFQVLLYHQLNRRFVFQMNNADRLSHSEALCNTIEANQVHFKMLTTSQSKEFYQYLMSVFDCCK